MSPKLAIKAVTSVKQKDPRPSRYELAFGMVLPPFSFSAPLPWPNWFSMSSRCFRAPAGENFDLTQGRIPRWIKARGPIQAMVQFWTAAPAERCTLPCTTDDADTGVGG